MLLDCSGDKLGDKNIKDEDGVARLRESIVNQCAKKRIPNQTLLEDQEMALGAPMSPALFIEKLRKLPGILVEPGGAGPTAVAVRMIVTDQDPTSPTHGQPIKIYLSGFWTDKVLPEFSSILSSKFGLATREIRGWRSVLLAIHRQGGATLPQLKALFGDANGQRAILWKEQTQHRQA